MESPRTNASVVFFMVVSLVLDAIFAQETIDMKCNPSIRHRFDVCPDGYCCVRDEFLPTFVYCRKIGLEDENCTTKDTESECPCASGLACKPNIASAFQSLYGRCYNATKHASTTPPPTTTPTTITTTTTPIMVTSDPIDTTTTPTTTNANTNAAMQGSTDGASASSSSNKDRPSVPFDVPVVG